MKHEEFMRRAIALSRRCVIDNGSAPFAALIVKQTALRLEGCVPP
jgi:tRNA(Arg) A34 adenosine deaminase TadA